MQRRRGALAGAAWTDDHDRVAFVDRQVKMLEDDILTVSFGQVFDSQDGFRHSAHSAGYGLEGMLSFCSRLFNRRVVRDTSKK